jgi:peptidyl-prolyl cis-trans isomerase A (cyclophilin A)
MRGFGILPFAVLLLLTVAIGAQQPAPAKPVLVIFETELGRITMEVDVLRAPITGENFLKYVDGKFYDGGSINRAVRPDNTTRHDVEIQVIQFQINPERNREQFPPIPMERTSVTGLKHLNGTLSMARSGPDTARASFSIVIGDQPEMDFGGRRNADGQGFAVFGRVVEGMDIVKKIQAARTLPAGQRGPYGTETLDPPIKIFKAYRKQTKEMNGTRAGSPLRLSILSRYFLVPTLTPAQTLSGHSRSRPRPALVVSRIKEPRHFFEDGTNPMDCFLGSGGAISSLIASKTTLNCASYFLSSALSLRAKFA